MLSQALTTAESAEVQMFLNVGEYGVALETLCGIIVEGDKTIPREAYERMSRLFDTMNLEPDLLEHVKKHVDQSPTAN